MKEARNSTSCRVMTRFFGGDAVSAVGEDLQERGNVNMQGRLLTRLAGRKWLSPVDSEREEGRKPPTLEWR